jgi:hypothetical protein
LEATWNLVTVERRRHDCGESEIGMNARELLERRGYLSVEIDQNQDLAMELKERSVELVIIHVSNTTDIETAIARQSRLRMERSFARIRIGRDSRTASRKPAAKTIQNYRWARKRGV